jgi:hypothetical protein
MASRGPFVTEEPELAPGGIFRELSTKTFVDVNEGFRTSRTGNFAAADSVEARDTLPRLSW